MSPTLLPFDMTPAAAARIAQLLRHEPEGAAFVVEVQGGGCSGFQYHFALQSAERGEGSLWLERDGARLAVDATSLSLLHGAVLDYTEDLAQAGFSIINPNATARCGCGNSFSV